jgi:GDPmannose 4,6-dehydratase
MWLMLPQPAPGDYVIATGETHSVREFAELAFSMLQLDYRKYVTIDRQLFRPAEVDVLQGDASCARRILGWSYRLTFEDLVREMAGEDPRRQRIEGSRCPTPDGGASIPG